MANTYSAFGFRPVGRREGGAPTAGLDMNFIHSSYATAIFTGDPVIRSTATGMINVPSSGTNVGPPLLGIFMGCEYYDPSVNRVVWNSYFPASVSSSSPVLGYYIGDPDQVFSVQAATHAVLSASANGLNIAFCSSFQTSGNTTTGISAVSIDPSVVGVNSSYPFKIVDASCNHAPPGVNGTDGTAAGAIMLVQLNYTVRNALTAGST